MSPSANPEWDVPQTIRSRFGDLDLNVTDPVTLLRYQVLPEDYQVVPALRVVQQNLSQMDGAELFPRFKTGMVVTLTLRLQKMRDATTGYDYDLACAQDLVSMMQTLSLWLNSMRDLENSDSQRYVWQPTGTSGERALMNAVLLSWPDPDFGQQVSPDALVRFALESPFPYAVDEAEETTEVTDGGSASFFNNGSADTWPVILVQGPATSWTITNETTGLLLEYDDTRPGAIALGASDYCEIDFFRGSAFLNGNSTDMIPGIVPTTSDFFTILAQPSAANVLSIDGADMTVLWHQGYS